MELKQAHKTIVNLTKTLQEQEQKSQGQVQQLADNQQAHHKQVQIKENMLKAMTIAMS